MSKPDLEKLKRLTEECHEVTVMWFNKKGRALEGSGLAGSPTLMPALLDHIEKLEVVERAARSVTAGMQGAMSNLFGALDDLDGIERTEEM